MAQILRNTAFHLSSTEIEALKISSNDLANQDNLNEQCVDYDKIFSIIYHIVLNYYKTHELFLQDNNDIFEIAVNNNIKIKGIKFYNKEDDYLHFCGIELYQNGKRIEDSNLPNYSYVYGSVFPNPTVEYKFQFNTIKKPYLFHTLQDSGKNFLSICFSEAISIDQIKIYNRTDDSLSMRAVTFCVDLIDPNNKIITVFSNFDKIYKDIENIYKICLQQNYHTIIDNIKSYIYFFILFVNNMYYIIHNILFNYKNINLDDDHLIRLKDFINNILFKTSIKKEFCQYGFVKTFRLFSDDEKIAYLQKTKECINLMYALTPNIFYAFGTVLGFVRERDYFIPHDYDIDIICVFSCKEYKNYLAIQNILLRFFKRHHIDVLEFAQHFYHVKYKNSLRFDIFTAIEDYSGQISCYPLHRGKYLHKSYLYPTINMNVMGIDCPIPKNPFQYLDVTYGQDWKIPIDKNLHIKNIQRG